MSRVFVRALGVVLLTVAAASAQSTPRAAGCCGDNSAAEKGKASMAFPPPCQCPLWVIQDLGATNLYYAEYHESNCSSPEVSELEGDFPLSQGCEATPNNCLDLSALRKAHAERHYPGRDAYIRQAEMLALPPDADGKGALCAKLFDVSYIRFQPDPNEEGHRYAKVFGFELDRKTRYGNDQLTNPRIFVAVEMDRAPVGDVAPLASTERLEPVDITVKCYVFRAVVRERGMPRQILLLTKGEAKK